VQPHGLLDDHAQVVQMVNALDSWSNGFLLSNACRTSACAFAIISGFSDMTHSAADEVVNVPAMNKS
jgi:hypothetical protein